MKSRIKTKPSVFLLAAWFFLLYPFFGLAFVPSSTNFQVQNPVIDNGAKNSTSSNFKMGQSFSQVAIGKSTSTSFQLLSGFQYFFSANPNVLSATAGNGQVALSWNAPQTYFGAVVASYDLGVGTTSGSYTYSTVGNVTSYTQTGLSNGTTYYFKVRAKTAGGITLTYSNEASAAPGGASPTSVSSGGGGSGYAGGIRFSGQSSPQSDVYLLNNGQLAQTVKADNAGNFVLNLLNLPPGAYNFVIYTKDIEGGLSSFLSFPLSIGSSLTLVNNLLLSPSLSADKAEVKKGEAIVFSGYSLPNTTVALNLTGQSSLDFSANTNALGKYVLNIKTDNLSLGNFNLKSKVILGNNASGFSRIVDFLVGEKDVLSKLPTQCPNIADFNNDCRVNLVDFSIMAYWFDKPNPPADIDLNSDGKVDLIDFSILAYYWSG